ncbi:MAG: hypothetical protein KN64_01325 [Sulfurovum sp. AS07-7]|nr:MAG: hypothetical protein KN64_01325 [Sulfurovum sp. AS07-7]
MKKMQNIGDKLTFSINTDEPINIKDLANSLNAFSEEYLKSAKIKDSLIQVTEVRKGSYVFDLIMVAKEHILPMIENANITMEFIGKLNKIKKFFLLSNEQKEDYIPSKQDSENIKNMLQPIYNISNDGTMTINFITNNNHLDGFSVTVPEAKIIRDNATKHIKQLDTKNQDKEEVNFFSNKLIYFVQTRLNSKDKGQKSICEEISKNEMATIFSNGEIQNEIMDNPYHYAFFVDIKIHRIKGEIKVYEITNIHQKIERDIE